ncbi:ABC-2 type transporter [Corchorus olitorius]|uniref:ABC-2 type transporter n=1 Tax=Corchorus olitorius TaxID=93759 RepID=A0A1R3HD55_9ROSI|nr:ABC-2 type transporter [Corchorus olitorius]
MESAIWIVFTYYTIGFAPAASRFFRQFLAFFAIHQMSLSLFRFIAAVGRTQVVANTLGTFALLLVFVLGGFIIAKDDIDPWMIWGYYLSPMMYAQNALVMNEFLDKRWSANNTDPRIDAPTVGKVLLKSRGFYTEDYLFWVCVGALFGFSVVFNLCFIGALTFLNPMADSKAVVVNEEDNKNYINPNSGGRKPESIKMQVRNSSSEIIEAVEDTPRKGMVLPFKPLALVFNHINYYVDMPAMFIDEVMEWNQELIKELSTPTLGSNDLYFPTKYSQTFLTQCKACFWKQYWSYWRDPGYNAIRFFLTVIIGILFGLIFWNKGQQTTKQQDLINVLGAMYTAVFFLGSTNTSAVLAVVARERTVFYRERAAGMYSEMPYAFAQVAIEIIYTAIQSLIYTLILFAMIGFEWTAIKFLWFYYYILTSFVYFTLYGMMLTALTPNHQIAAIVMSFFLSFWNLFSGFLIPRTYCAAAAQDMKVL